jgi:nicotinate-nucleotide adenylyltransferase
MLSEAMVKFGPNIPAGDGMRPHRRHVTPRLFHDSRRRFVGLIGGSFNPAHDGHLHMADRARKALGVDEVWWLVTPQNPLKSSQNMAPLDLRVKQARKISTAHSYIRVIAPEQNLRKSYTFKTLNYLKKKSPRMQFIWIMGADNLVQFPAWERHHDITRRIPIAVIDRPRYSYTAISTGRHVLSSRISARRLGRRGHERRAKPPVWCFIAGRRHHASATALRAQGTAW